MSAPQPAPRCFCPECWALLSPKATRCWLCHRRVRRAVAVQPPTLPPPPPRAAVTPYERRAQFQFSLASLMLVMTLTAVVLGVGVMAPGLGIALAVLAAPALVRTSIVAARSRAHGQPLSVEAKVALFAGSLVVVGIIVVAAAAAFYATCFAGFWGGAGVSLLWADDDVGTIIWGLATGILLGSLVAIFVAYRLVRVFWLRKRRNHRPRNH